MTNILTRLDEAAARAICRERAYFVCDCRVNNVLCQAASNKVMSQRHPMVYEATAARRAILAALEAEGLVVVPKEATREMLNAGDDAIIKQYRDNPEWEESKDMAENLPPDPIYAAMLAAAPTLKESSND